jgi:uncharacterized protein (DUF697 family)
MNVVSAVTTFNKIRSTVDTKAVHAQVKRPFRFFLCGDPALVAAMRVFLLSGHADEHVPLDAAACLETVLPNGMPILETGDAKAVLFLGLPGDLAGANLAMFAPLKLPVLAITVDASVAAPSGPASHPRPGAIEEYVVPRIDRTALKTKLLPHLIDCCRGIEIAVGRRLPALRETVALKLTRDAANNALRVAGASAVVDQVPVFGALLGAFTSAGDMVALTGIQMMLMFQIGATYGRDPDVQRVWELLPIVGGGFGWRIISRELSGFIPVAGIFIKGAIAYAGTIVVGESASFYYQHGRHMSRADAAQLYVDTKNSAIQFARDTFSRIRNRN